MDKKIIGNWGEMVAKNYLETKGYKILETNWHYHHKELDIIAYKDGLVGFEIKTRTSEISPAFTVLGAKQVARLRLTLNAYCRLKHFNYNLARLDLITIKIKNKDTITLCHHLDI
jgi:Predicted endonuclease distantly related to archaeal Holliday junction resolvase